MNESASIHLPDKVGEHPSRPCLRSWRYFHHCALNHRSSLSHGTSVFSGGPSFRLLHTPLTFNFLSARRPASILGDALFLFPHSITRIRPRSEPCIELAQNFRELRAQQGLGIMRGLRSIPAISSSSSEQHAAVERTAMLAPVMLIEP